MSGYAKRMMEAAKEWLAANPDPDATSIRVPRGNEDREETHAERAAKLRSLMERAPDDPRVHEIAALLERVHLENDRLHELNDSLEEALTTSLTTPGASFIMAPDEDSASVIHGYWMIQWARDGYNVIELSSSFVAAMLLTDPAAIDTGDLRLPFGGMLLLLPSGFVTGPGGDFTRVHVCAIDRLENCAEHGAIVDITASSGSALLSTSAELTALTMSGLSAFEDEHVDDSHRSALDTLRRIVIGALVYMASVPAAMERRDVTRKRRGRSEALRPAYWDMARMVRIDPRLVGAARSGSREIAFRLKHRHIVRGHYRNQPIGEGRKERKTIWIAPFWKGPADGAAIVHTYKPATPPGSE